MLIKQEETDTVNCVNPIQYIPNELFSSLGFVQLGLKFNTIFAKNYQPDLHFLFSFFREAFS